MVAQHLPFSQEYNLYIDSDTNEKQTQGGHSNAPAGFQRQRASRLENVLGPFLTGSDDLSFMPPTFVQTPLLDATHIWRAKKRNDVALEHDNPSSQSLIDSGFQGQFPFSGNDSPQAGSFVRPWIIPLNGAADLDRPTPWPETDLSTVRPSAVGHPSSQNFWFPFSGNEHSKPGEVLWHLPIPSSTAAGPPTSSTTTTVLSAQLPVCPSVAGPHVIAADDIRTLGSPQIQQAATRRRKKGGIYQCPFSNCTATFTEPHNLQYHINAHLYLKPYACSECSYAAASPATLKRHLKRHQ